MMLAVHTHPHPWSVSGAGMRARLLQIASPVPVPVRSLGAISAVILSGELAGHCSPHWDVTVERHVGFSFLKVEDIQRERQWWPLKIFCRKALTPQVKKSTCVQYSTTHRGLYIDTLKLQFPT